MPEPVIRAYTMEDELMLTRAQTQKTNLLADLALFTARFPWLTATYTTNYQTDIDTADAVPLDDAVMTDIKVLTSDLAASMTEAKAQLKNLFLFGEITYPNDKVKQRVFGQDLMDKARNDQEKMENLLEHANSFADKVPYKTDLLARGYTQVEIDALATTADNINTKNRLQENAKASRPVTTQDRIQVYNTVFAHMPLISKCAQIVFAGNPAKIEQYRVYPPGASDTTTADVKTVNSVGGAVLPGLTVRFTNTDLAGQITDAGGIAHLVFGPSDVPDAVDIEVSGPGILSQTFSGEPILAGEDNLIELQVGV